MKPTMRDVPVSLDRLHRAALMALWAEHNQAPVKAARRWFPRRQRGYVKAAKDIANYAANRAAYLYCKKQGNKTGTHVYRAICDNIAEHILIDDPSWFA